ncbi:sensor histidine kinase [Flavihumibacter profundi]|uniref:sensor histidine kinase n=1 Tax=Flavihumibacter profundi TaxID=2716883 RepID=UPI001CC76D47|nr:histidine kinase [Flavihumibacter profundi]MBZ5857255.1 histidine kinase [Flavihumibacter profundi]
MKIRWREHELLLITILAVVQVINILMNAYHAGYEDIRQLTERFSQAALDFNYGWNVLLPKVGSVVLFYCTYLAINKLLIPLLRKISFNEIEKILSASIARAFALVITFSFLLALGANLFSYFGRPDFFNYAEYGLLALLGYNDQPLTDIFFGFQRALGIVLTILSFGILRELAISRIERDGPQKDYRILMANNITLIISIYLIIISFINPLHITFIRLLFTGIAGLLFYIYTTFWLFPFKADRKFRSKPVLTRLLLAAFCCSIPFWFVFDGDDERLAMFLRTWGAFVFIVTPIFWVLYQLRKDNLLALRGIRAELANSTADLQFLRAQINPHFLFNALNTLYGTALMEKSELTANGIQKLGDMMRFVLHENNKDFISMQKETEYLSNYIDLQKLRLQTSPGILIEDNLEETNCRQQIAPMLLIPLVENAFKHGISHQEKSWIHIRLECGDNTIYFEVKNSLHKNRDTIQDNDASGIGLANVRERLNLIYPNRHELYIHQDAREFIARLLIKETSSIH